MLCFLRVFSTEWPHYWVSTAFSFSVPVMPSKPAGAGKSAQLKNKNQGVRGPPHYATNPTGTIKTCRQNTRDAVSAIMSQLGEKSAKKIPT